MDKSNYEIERLYSAFKQKQILQFLTSEMILEDTVSSEINQTQTGKSCIHGNKRAKPWLPWVIGK
jgi:hypothetical protein